MLASIVSESAPGLIYAPKQAENIL